MKRKVKRRSGGLPPWSYQVQETLSVKRDDREMIIAVQRGRDRKTNKMVIMALAVEGPPNAGIDVLDDHAHKLIGSFKTIEAAKRASERYALKWIEAGTSVEKCPCKEPPT